MNAFDHLENAVVLDRLKRSCFYIQEHYKTNPFMLKLLRESPTIFKIWYDTNFYRTSFWDAARDTFVSMLENDVEIEFLRHLATVGTKCF